MRPIKFIVLPPTPDVHVYYLVNHLCMFGEERTGGRRAFGSSLFSEIADEDPTFVPNVPFQHWLVLCARLWVFHKHY